MLRSRDAIAEARLLVDGRSAPAHRAKPTVEAPAPLLHLDSRQLENALANPNDSLPDPRRALDVDTDDAVAFSIEEIMTAGDFGMLGGEDGSFKSSIALHMAAARAGGYRVFGRFQAELSDVLIISEEDSVGVVVNRLRAICRGQGWDATRVLANIFVLARAEVRLTSLEWQAHLLRLVQEYEFGFVIVDPLVEVTTGEENSPSEGRANLQVLRALAKPTGANILVIHHFGKPAEGKRLRDRLRGNTAITSGSRFTFVVEHDEEARELKMTCVKMSRGEKPKPFIVRYVITAEEGNRTSWESARFDYVSAQVAVLDRAESFVREQLEAGDRMNTSELKTAAKGTGVSGADISRAIKHLEMRRLIDHIVGPKGAKQWGIVCLPTDSRQPGQPEIQLAGQPDSLPGNQLDGEFCLPSPFRGKQELPASEPWATTTEQDL